ncbi:hypothetical protein A343_2142 [Porphyromonas gingivalis JCVI SC001]|nr:hypothetical protein A343_2142 [Porphyromonas gingivalis JCVI SC001]
MRRWENTKGGSLRTKRRLCLNIENVKNLQSKLVALQEKFY